MSTLDIEIVDVLSPTLRRLRAAAADLALPMAEASEAMLEDTFDNFQGEHDPLGIPWTKSKGAAAEGRPTLQKSGDLRNAVDRQSGADFAAVGVYGTGGPAIYGKIHQWGGTIDHPGGTSYFQRDGRAVFVGNAVAERFARMHGKELPKTKPHKIPMPRRSFLGFSDQVIMQIDRILVRHLLRAVNAGAPA